MRKEEKERAKLEKVNCSSRTGKGKQIDALLFKLALYFDLPFGCLVKLGR